ncbi:MAG: immune inhibitor A [Candidatus Cloacimonetes bacterium]|nr:immune inhibitor A [Candidatus Cloacimonadota bacterium]
MKKLLVSLLIVAFTFSLFAASNSVKIPQEVEKATSMRLDREIDVFYEEGFEAGIGEWTTLDETLPSDWLEWWHLTTTEAYDGNSWWMGDEDLGGYFSHRYIVLDTPVLNIPAAGYDLTFKVAWSVEDPGGEPPPYNGWDGCNVEVSTNGGDTFTAIEGTPAYGATDLYSFGDEFNEGPGVPGWVSNSGGFQDASFDLSSFSGQDIVVRFAFCSDPAYDTTDNASMFGMVVDNILISNGSTTLFESDGEGASGDALLIPGYGGEAAGDYFEIATDNPHVGSNAAHCPVEYNLINSIVSPLIPIPDDPNLEEEVANIDYFVYCDVLDADGNGDNSLEDLYMVFVKGETETMWTRLHFNFFGPESGGVPAEWTLIDQAYAEEVMGWQNGSCDVSEWIGQSIQIKFQLSTDDNDDGGVGSGLYIDDVRAYMVFDVGPPPENIQANTNDDNTVTISWSAPGSTPPDPGWYSYFGELSHLSWSVPERATKFDLAENATYYISSAKHTFYEHSSYPWGDDTTFKFKIYDGEGVNVLYESDTMDALQYPNETEVTFDPVEITGSFYLSIAPTNGETGMPSSAANESEASHGYVGEAGAWTLGTLEWASFVYVTDQTGRAIDFDTQNTTTRDEPIGYKIYHSEVQGGDYDLIGETDATTLEYTHNDPISGIYNYYVLTTIYEVGDSPYSDEVSAFVEPDMNELSFDDGTCEGTFDVNMPNQALVRFIPLEQVDNGGIYFFKFYINEEGSGQVVVRIYFEGDNGLPEANPIYTALISGDEVSIGWNYIAIDPYVELTEIGAPVFAGILAMGGSPGYGLDTNSQGQTYVGISSSQMVVSDQGNAMFRLIGNFDGSDSGENIIVPEKVTISNYPNPFNPETTIKFNIPEDGSVSLKIYNMKGQLVKTMLNDKIKAGHQELTWGGNDNNGNSVASGLYFYKLNTESKVITKKMLLLK